MILLHSLPIDGYRGHIVRNTLYRREAPSDHLAVVFPDLLYPSTAPLLYYTRELLLAGGADVLTVDDDYEGEWRNNRFLEDVVAVYETAGLYHPFDRLTVIGKALGTIAAAYLVREARLPEQAEVVWIAPPVDAESVVETLRACRYRSLVVAGSYPGSHPSIGMKARAAASGERAELIALRENDRMTVHLFEGADDNLERAGEPLVSLDLLNSYVHLLADFLELPVRSIGINR